ncbi:MAG: excinuclease ABC subunit UvrB [Bacteroidota bacterium]
MKFKLTSPYEPAGDQPRAIEELLAGVKEGAYAQTLLGATGTGKTFTMAKVIEKLNKPTLIVSHNKTLAAQLYGEFSQFFPDNAVEYFVSYYDYFQPEAYIPSTGTYIEKDLAINAEIEKLRLRAASSLLSGRRDVVVVSSVSCIYGMSNPTEFYKYVLRIKQGQTLDRDAFLLQLVGLLYSRHDEQFRPGAFRVKGDTVDVFLAYTEVVYRFIFFGDEVEQIQRVDPESGARIEDQAHVVIYPANLFVTSKDVIKRVMKQVQEELTEQVRFFERQGKSEEAERLESRTELDLEMMETLGYCPGIENYSRYFDGREARVRPYCLMDYFPSDYLLFLDESHVTIPQVRGMWGGDHARKRHLVEYGFRLPSAMDNRPLNFDEFTQLIHQVIYVSATPSDYEIAESEGVVVEQLIRPTGLLDPEVTVVPTEHQIDHLLDALHERIQRKEQVLVITLTKRMAEELTKYLTGKGIRCQYIHSEVDTLDRVRILHELGEGKFDVLVGVNLLREGLDLPGVSLVTILEADKEGFLRNKRSLLQMIGRAARHVRGAVYMYADKITPSMKNAIKETARRRELQIAHNEKHGITPQPVTKALNKLVEYQDPVETKEYAGGKGKAFELQEQEDLSLNAPMLKKRITEIKKQMERASAKMDYITAHKLKKELAQLKKAYEDSLKPQKNNP